MRSTLLTMVSAKCTIVFTCFLISFSALCQSDTHDELEQMIHDYLMNEINPLPDNEVRIKVRDIDERIDIPECGGPFSFSNNGLAQNQSNVSVKVRCDNTNWYVFAHANVMVIQEVVVSKENLSPGTLLSKRNLEIIEIDKNRLRGSTFSFIEDISGSRLKRRIRAGSIIDGRMLCFVCKGDRVTIAAVSRGLSLKVYGVAEEDGILGDTIQVRNLSSDKLVYGKVASTNEVHINI